MTALMHTLAQWPRTRIINIVESATTADVEQALGRDRRTPSDLAILFSNAARSHLEAMAREAQQLTRRFFGRTVALYAPLYVSNVCGSDCPYCGFSCRHTGGPPRVTLDAATIHEECKALSAHGFQNVLLVSGEAPHVCGVEYLADTVTIAREYFPSVSVEVYALDEAGYQQLFERGLEGVTLYMETYDRPLYEQLHQRGAKANYEFRLGTLERAGRAGVRKLNLGALLGLTDWRVDLFHAALHARYLQQTCWRSAVAMSFPRLHHVPDGFSVSAPVTDCDLTHAMLALRLFLPEAGFTLSTRERAVLRDNLIPLGVTLMSAGSSTRPGGYAQDDGSLEQFTIDDNRSPAEVAAAIRRAGYDAVWKDFDRAFDAVGR